MLPAPIANHLVRFFFLEPIAALIAISIVVAVALVRRLNPLVTIVTPPALVHVTMDFIRAAVLAPVLVKVKECGWLVLIT
jgi:hypothetical protein